jgi:hypothetical protein
VEDGLSALPPPLLLLLLPLPYLKLPFLFGFLFRFGFCFSLGLGLLVLELQRLLGFGADSVGFHLFLDGALHALGIGWGDAAGVCEDGRAERKLKPMVQQKLINLVILWLRAERDFADLQLSVCFPLVHADPERVLKENRQRAACCLHSKSLLVRYAKTGQPKRQVTGGKLRARTTNRDCVFIFARV